MIGLNTVFARRRRGLPRALGQVTQIWSMVLRTCHGRCGPIHVLHRPLYFTFPADPGFELFVQRASDEVYLAKVHDLAERFALVALDSLLDIQ